MQYFIKMNCGHGQMLNINGCAEHIQKKLKYFKEKAICKRCYMQMQLKNMIDPEEVRMPYYEYKIRYRKFPYQLESYNKTDKTIVVYLPKKYAELFKDSAEAKEKARLEREERKRLAELQKAERAAKRAAEKAARPPKQKIIKPPKPPVLQPPLILRPPEATLFLKRLAVEYNKMYKVAITELQKRDVRIAYGRLHLFYSSYGKKDWERLVANNDIVNLKATQIVQLAQNIYNTTEKDRVGCVKR